MLRLERDRHVAFAFAAADLLIEVSNGGKIIAAAGAAQAILGVGVPGLTGMPILDFVAAADRPLARRLLENVHAQLRIDPVVVDLVRGDGVAHQHTVRGVPTAGPGRQCISERGPGAQHARTDRPAA